MLFRCQTCPRALCEDCLPESDIDAVGNTLPELCVPVLLFTCCASRVSPFLLAFDSLIRDYGAKSTAYYIRCTECHARWKEEPQLWADWQQEMRENEERLARLQDGESD